MQKTDKTTKKVKNGKEQEKRFWMRKLCFSHLWKQKKNAKSLSVLIKNVALIKSQREFIQALSEVFVV